MRGVFDILAAGQERGHIFDGVADGTPVPKQINHSPGEVKEIQDKLWTEVKGGMAADGIHYSTMEDVGKGLVVNLEHLVKKAKDRPEGMAADAFFNEFTGIGTGIDPGFHNASSTPVVVSPQEATAYYSNGGIAATVIDKKSQGVFTNGYQFVGGLEEDDLKELKDYADKLNFAESLVEWWRDGYIYGGSTLMPWLKGDNVLTHEMTVEELGRRGMLKKDCLQYFWTADRWNAVLIPNYDISARDYLTPETFYVPLAGLSIRTERMAIARPKKLPYWGTIRQMGWGISDFPSFMPSLLAYEIMIRTIPIISQQLSLVYLHQPLDTVLAQSGANAARKVQQSNQAAIDQWNSLKTQVLNMSGELKSIERHWTDFDKLILIGKQDVGAKAGISHTILFNEQHAALNDKSDDTTLKQAETIKRSGNQLTIQVQNVIQFLVYSKWGWDSPQARKAKEVRLSLDSPTVMTNQERLEALNASASALGAYRMAGFQLGDAVELVRKFVPMFEPTEEMATRIEAFDDAETDFEEEQRDQTLALGKQKTGSADEEDAGTGNPPTPRDGQAGDAKPGVPSWVERVLRRTRK
ncbi:phage portal protein [Tetrasphaera phage TJE1]|uniref:Phage portal protein n=1 Tax=Tetrasphaera phage TJE1 TaxID=981335 RepID=G4W953_9CAUD|nr:phage portal protein [Tetrasphaera phage TJE1]ADX42541.1 phage portal protein [Tetrasphaera phage TJE1]